MALTKVTPSMFEGSAGGGGAENFITDNQASFAISSFTTAKYTAGTRPPATLISSGSPAISAGFSTSNPLFNTKNFELIKPASNCQGEAWYYDFSVPSFTASRPSICTIDLPYKIASGTFNAGTDSTDSDVICYIAFNDAGTWKPLEPSDFKFRSNTIDKFRAGFQTILGVTQYRLMLYVASTSASAYTIHLDKISVGPQASGSCGPFFSAEQKYSPTVLNLGAGGAAFNTAVYREAAGYLEVQGRFTKDGIAGSGTDTVTFLLPSGYTIDTARMADNSSTAQVMGVVENPANGAAYSLYWSYGTNGVCFYNTSGFVQGVHFTANLNWNYKFTVPIVGRQSATRISDGYDGREISAYISRSGTHTMTTSLAKIPFNSVTFDDIAAWDNTNFEYEAKSAGTYFVDVEILGGSVTGHYVELHKKPIGGSFSAYASSYSPTRKVNANFAIKLNAGERIAPFGNLDSGTSTLDNVFCSMRIRRCESTQAVAASEKVFGTYELTAATSIPHDTYTTLIFNNKAEDSHGLVNASNGRITFNRAGRMRIRAQITYSGGVLGGFSFLDVTKNGTVNKRGPQTTSSPSSVIDVYVYGVQGDYFNIRAYQDSGVARSLQVGALDCYLDFSME